MGVTAGSGFLPLTGGTLTGGLTGTTATFTGDLTVDTNTLYVDSTNNRVGIGTSSPSVNAEIRGSSSNGQIRLGGSTTGTYGQFYSDNDGVLVLGADAGNNAASSSFRVEVDGTERMRIDSSGNLLVGKTSSAVGTAGHELLSYGRAVPTVNASTVQIINRLSNDGDMTIFQKDGTTVGSIGTTGGKLYIENGDTGLRFEDANNIIHPSGTNGGDRDAATDLGSSSVRFKDLYLSGGVVETTTTVTYASSIALTYNNGSIQTVTLTGNVTFTDSLADGESVVLMLNAGASYTVTWPTMTWTSSSGNVAPTLTANDTLVFWKIGSTLYGAYAGSYT